MKKITFLIPVAFLFVIMMPGSIQEHPMRAAHAAATYVSSNTVHTSAAPAYIPTSVPNTMPADNAIYLPLILINFSTTPPIEKPTATHTATQTVSNTPTHTSKLTLTPTITASVSSTPTQMPTVTSTPTYTPSPTSTQTPTATPTQATLIIGHITDAHIGLGWLESQRLPLVVSTLSQEAEVMVDTGDCTAHGTAAECVEYVDLVTRSATIPWRAVTGPLDSPHTFEAHIGPLEWSWDVGGYRLIGINTEAINYTALDQALTTGKPCIIFGHFPLDQCSPADQNKLRQRFLTYDIPIYIAGHAHLNSLETDPDSGTLLLIGQRTVRCHYRLITLRGFEVESIEFKLACQ